MDKADGPILIEDLDAVVAGARPVPDRDHPPSVALHKPVRTHSLLEVRMRRVGRETYYDPD